MDPPGNLTLGYGDWATVTLLTDPSQVDSVVFLRPGSVTHAFDYDQRLVEAEEVQVSILPPEVTFRVPTNRRLLPPGYYMVWVRAQGGTVLAFRAFLVKVVP